MKTKDFKSPWMKNIKIYIELYLSARGKSLLFQALKNWLT